MSTLGVPNIVKCPGCGQLLEEMCLTSGNTLYARFWSDGKTDAPMLPHVPFIIKCPGCGEIFLPREHYHKLEPDPFEKIHSAMHRFFSDEAEGQAGESWMERRERENRMSARISAMNLPDTMKCGLGFHDAVRAFDMIDDRKAAHFLIWHTYNDFYRNGDRKGAEQEREVFLTFTDGLLKVFGYDDNDMLLRAELYRQLGEFGKCVETLDLRQFGGRYAALAEQVREKAVNRETEVFCFDIEG